MLALGEKRGRKNPRSQALFHGPPTLKITNLPVLSTMTNNKYCLTCAAGGVWGAPSPSGVWGSAAFIPSISLS